MGSLARNKRRAQARLVMETAVPAAPREPSEEAHRLLFGYHGRQKHWLRLGLFWSLTGLFTLVTQGLNPLIHLAISLGSTSTRGRAVRAKRDRSLYIDGENPTRVRFEYEVDGWFRTGEDSTFEPDIISSVRTGRPLTLEVSRFRPSWVRLADASVFSSLGPSWLLLPLAGVGLWVRLLRDRRRQVAAFTRGQPVLGRIIKLTTSSRQPGPPLHTLRWEFEVQAQRYTGQLRDFELGSLESLSEGDSVRVLYLPEDPRVNTLYIP